LLGIVTAAEAAVYDIGRRCVLASRVDGRLHGHDGIGSISRRQVLQFIAVHNLSQSFAAKQIPVPFYLRITGKFEFERPHVQSCAGEAETYSQNTKKKEE